MPQPRIEGRGFMLGRVRDPALPNPWKRILKRKDHPAGNKFGLQQVFGVN